MKTATLTLCEHDAAILRDALIDAAIALRTNSRTENVMTEDDFLNNPEISEGRKNRYNVLMENAEELRDFVRMN